MSIWGKILSGARSALGGPLGALIGTALDHEPDQPAAGPAANGGDAPDYTRKIGFTIGVIALGAKMAKADGWVSRDEVTAFRQAFHVPADELPNVARVFNIARRDIAGFETYARQIAGMFEDRPAVLEDLLACLIHIAEADGSMKPPEIAFLQEVARIFGLSDAAFDRILAAEAGSGNADPYAILGIGRDDDNRAIKAAYRKLIRELHPDRLIAQGLPQEFIAVATGRMAAINAAYDQIAKQRGIR